jgi:hypothetical protein
MRLIAAVFQGSTTVEFQAVNLAVVGSNPTPETGRYGFDSHSLMDYRFMVCSLLDQSQSGMHALLW